MKIKKKSKSGRNVVDCKMRLKKKGNMGKKLKNEKTPAGSEGESGSEMMLERSNISATQEWIVEDDDTSESRVLESENGTGGENDDFKDNEHSFLLVESKYCFELKHLIICAEESYNENVGIFL